MITNINKNKMKKLLIIISAIVLFASCGSEISEKNIIGQYNAKLIMNETENDEGGAFAMALLSGAEIVYNFQEDGILTGSVTMGSIGQNNSAKWKLEGDKIYLDIEEKPDEYYIITKEKNGFKLSGKEMDMILTEID